MEDGTSGTHQQVAFGSLRQEVRSALLQFAAEDEILVIEEQTFRGHTLYEVEVEPAAHQSFRLVLGTNGALLDKVFTGRCRQDPAPGCCG